MKSIVYATLATLTLGLTLSASARDVVLPAGTLLQCTLNEPNFSPSTAAVGDPVLCNLRGITEFGQQAFPRGSYLVGHLESAKQPGHFVGKGNMRLQFDRIGLPSGDLPLDAKVIATRGYKVNKDGDIRGKGHAKRDVVEWMLPPLWPWKVIMLPARGPQPALKGESVMTLRLMDDVQVPQVAQRTYSWLGLALFHSTQKRILRSIPVAAEHAPARGACCHINRRYGVDRGSAGFLRLLRNKFCGGKSREFAGHARVRSDHRNGSFRQRLWISGWPHYLHISQRWKRRHQHRRHRLDDHHSGECAARCAGYAAQQASNTRYSRNVGG